jgi:inosine/xanthosine triphosphate pyrophosphatase family protein
MRRLPVESSDLVSVGYDPAQKILEVEFQGGRVYQYREVEPDIHAQFMRADSFGTFFFAHINGRYRYEKIRSVTDAEDNTALAFVSGSDIELHDFQVACEPYGIEVESLELPTDEVQADDAEEIASKKAKQAQRLAQQPVVVSTLFWNVIALRGFPGAYAQALGQWLTVPEILALLADKRDRSVSVTHTVVYDDGKRHKVCQQIYWGTVLKEPRGEGNSLEQLIQLNGQEQTIAESHDVGLSVSSIPQASAWNELAKWLRLQRRFEV